MTNLPRYAIMMPEKKSAFYLGAVIGKYGRDIERGGKMAKKGWESITVLITPEQRQALEEIADKEMASMSFLVRKAIEMFLVERSLREKAGG